MSARNTKNTGATKAGDGRFLFDLAKLARMPVGGAYSPAEGPVVEGERMQVGLITIRRGTASLPHTHPNEQWTYVLQGKARVSVDGQPQTLASPGTLIYSPANVVHSVEVLPDEDLVFFTVKDLSHGIVGTAAGAKTRASK
ncbi:MAG TPA: cupin domain-containing protein [Burkholderiales bacterium]|nr:cupin domain-containing protein [Burkholderiales bacterium]